jgi:hypothetical protein
MHVPEAEAHAAAPLLDFYGVPTRFMLVRAAHPPAWPLL